MKIKKVPKLLTPAELDVLFNKFEQADSEDPYIQEFDNPETDIAELHKKWGIPEPGFPEELKRRAN